MMNKILSISLTCAAALAFTGCAGEEDDLFSSSAAERLDESKTLYTERFESSDAGWVMEYYPTTDTEGVQGQGYLLLVDFNKNGMARMAMNNVFSGNAYLEDESAWEVITDNGPVLTFNTYNQCIHAFCDPAGNPALGTETGRGAEGDYEFVIIDLDDNAELAMLKGKKRGTYNRLTRLADGTDFEAYITDVQAFGNRMFSATAPNMCVITLGDSVMRMADASTGIPNIYPYDGDPITDESYHPYLITMRNGQYYFRFRDVLNAPDGTTAQEFVYDEERDIFTCVENPEFTLAGEDPYGFFSSSVADGATWRLNRTSEMSTEVQDAYEAVRTAFSGIRYTFNYLSFVNNNGALACALNVRNRNGATSNVYFTFDMTATENGCTLAYAAPNDDAAANMLSAVPEIQQLLDCFVGEYVVSPTISNFNLTNLRFASGDSRWFVLTHI